MNEQVLLEIRGAVATLTLNRPQAMNSLGQEMAQALLARAEELQQAAGVKVVVVTGAGDHFMAGGDIKEFKGIIAAAPEQRQQAFHDMISDYVHPAIEILRGLPQPVVAKVRGACAGFGFSLMAGCDLAVAADNAYFTTGYALLGTSADGGSTWFLPRLIGAKRAAELMLLAERIDAQQALSLGLVNRVVPLAELDAACAALAQRLAAGPAQAHAGTKRLLGQSLLTPLTEQLGAEAQSFARCSATADFAEGVAAFIEKRKPAFKGH
ncbi:MAG: enoyl-CoA hydratase [Betaproteobacteria bacterium]|nr:enoyl-CoA hydratase [Betaproteobacteria bacterium]